MKHEFTVFVTNVGDSDFDFPFTTLVEKNALCAHTPPTVRPQETVAVCFSYPETSHGTREKIEKWAATGGHVVAVAWNYCHCPDDTPQPPVQPDGQVQIGSMPIPGAAT